MDSWPFDLRPTVPTDRRSVLRRSEANKPIESRNALDVGSRGVAALTRSEAGRLEWRFAANPHSEGQRLSSTVASVVKIFPDTAPPPAIATRAKAHETADDALQFMHTHYPDVMGFPAELLESEIVADRATLNQDPFDVYRGNRLAAVRASEGPSAFGYLAWAMGYNMQSLNVASILPRAAGTHNYEISPQATPIVTLDTPIQQVIFRSVSNDSGATSLLGVRTISGTSIFQVNEDSEKPSLVVVENLGELQSEHTNGHRQVDLAIAGTSELNVVAVDDEGTVHRWSTEQLAAFPRSSDALPSDRFYRIAFCSDSEQVVLASSRRLQRLDFRSPDFVSLHDLAQDHRDLITGIEVLDGPELCCVTTTDHLAWFDARNTTRPLLKWKHHCAWDRTLSTSTFGSGSERSAFLWSRASPLVTAYNLDISHGLIATSTSPYTPIPKTNQKEREGFVVLPTNNPHASLFFDMSDRGSVFAQYFRSSDSEQGDQMISVDWSDDVNALEEDASKLAEDLGPFAERTNRTVDMRGIYEATFIRQNPSPSMKDALQEVAELLQKMPTVANEQEFLAEHMLTTFDMAFMSQEEPPKRRRSDFLTGTALSRVHAPADWLLSKIRDMKLSNTAALATSNAAFLQRTGTQLSSKGSDGSSPQAYLMMDPETRALREIMSTSETEAANTLALDIGLSENVYSNDGVRTSALQNGSAFDDLESAAGALSLKDPEPSALSFGYLRPRSQTAPTDVDDSTSQATAANEPDKAPVDASLGARLLLSDWIPGSDPGDYEYVDPYGVVEPRPRVPRTFRQTTAFKDATQPPEIATQGPLDISQLRQQPPMILSTQPPMILSTQPIPQRRVFPTSPAAPFASQIPRNRLPSTNMPASSQELWPSTQQVPGPFGERPEARAAKKKAARKRLAGF
ncbi:hypothetical protein CALCODRAFT_79845 [Calocera cornea HHB12733]|uniref:RRN6 beta-propeller domain-containing protein n=1 Tax=Calocera cornea HHB12733 TaxID=1353952 RepID=A0A165DFN0_9BASI|nr:hypothetical protein CALCODRAFT_79845 [Calocera cornea HHB12733]